MSIQIPSGTNEPFLSVLPLERIFLGSSPAERVPDDAKRKEMLDERTQQANMLLDQAFEMTPEGQTKPEIKLHAETNTLLVKATPAQLQVINQVLGALEVPGPSDSRRELERRALDMERQMAMERQRLTVEMDRQSAQMQQALDRAQKTQDELTARNRELTVQLEQLKAQLQAMKEQKPSQPQ
jgi:chromosome segregation ATPase